MDQSMNSKEDAHIMVAEQYGASDKSIKGTDLLRVSPKPITETLETDNDEFTSKDRRQMQAILIQEQPELS